MKNPAATIAASQSAGRALVALDSDLASMPCLAPERCDPCNLDLLREVSDSRRDGMFDALDPSLIPGALCSVCRARFFVLAARNEVRAVRSLAAGAPVRGVIYVREAAQSKGGAVFGNHNQNNRCQGYASEHGITIVDTVTDVGEPGGAPELRPNFLRALDIARRHAAVVIVADFVRVSRDAGALAAFFLSRPDALVVSASENMRSDDEALRRTWGALVPPASPPRAARGARPARAARAKRGARPGK